MKTILGNIIHVIAARRRERRCNGPYPSDKTLMLSLANNRNEVNTLPDAPLRAFLQCAMSHMAHSKSQIFQDVFVLHVLGTEKAGYFVDFGATDGVSLSNSYLLERSFGWQGICAEPARSWHKALRSNRPKAKIETRCVWTRTGAELSFRETAERELSTIDSYAQGDARAKHRESFETYQVNTVSLDDMLKDHGAPTPFDYLSIDTEGSEYDILTHFDIARYKPRVITVEHNYTPRRRDIYELLTEAGYRRVLTDVSMFDDWYLAPGVALPGE